MHGQSKLPTVVSLFAGCGGSSLGYKQAGFDVRLAVEWDSVAAAVYRLNFPDTPLFEGDIHSLPDSEALRLARVLPGELDVIDGSPPCQGFSTAGKRILSDSRNALFEEYVRLLKAFKPRALVMENVSGLIKGKMKLAFAEITMALKEAGYVVSCRLLNAWWYGVPQDRERLIWIGIRNALNVRPSHPKPSVNHAVTVREAFSGVGESDAPPLTDRYLDYWHLAGQGGIVGKLHSVRRLSLDHVAGTIVKSEGNGAPYHPTEPRAISTAERKRLGGFRDDFQFPSREDATVLIGNSVPPPMSQAIGQHVMKLLEAR